MPERPRYTVKDIVLSVLVGLFLLLGAFGIIHYILPEEAKYLGPTMRVPR